MSDQFKVIPNFEYRFLQGDLLPESLGGLNNPLGGALEIFSDDPFEGELSPYVGEIGSLLSKPDSFFKQMAEVLSSDIKDDVRLVPSEESANEVDTFGDLMHDITVGNVRDNCREWLTNEDLSAITKRGWIDEFLSKARGQLETWVMTAKKARNFAAECLKQEIPHPEAVIKTTKP